jgi:alanyl-tRNA synthetase
LKSGVVALFGEKYGEKVRVVRAGDFSAELCGGTHCSATGEIGQFRIVSESSIASGVRRIEAVTGRTALEFERERERELKKLSGLLRVDELKTYERVEKLLNELKQKERELERARQKAISIDINEILNKASDINGIKVISHALDGMDIKSLRSLSDRLKERIGSGVIVLGSSLDGQAYFVSAVTRDLTDRLHAGEILKSITGGKGGGRPDMAQGGSKDASDVERAISIAEDIIRKYITQEGS